MSDELKVGDVIAVNATYGRGASLHKIERVTPTMYICGHMKFRKDDLRVVGAGQWGPWQGRIPTADDFMRIRVARVAEKLRAFKVTPENVEAVEALIGGGE